MSATRTVSAPLAATPSVIIVRQNGQPVATVLAPVPRASAARWVETRCFGSSSIHMRPPPAPQQDVPPRLRFISQRDWPPTAVANTSRGASWMPFTRAR